MYLMIGNSEYYIECAHKYTQGSPDGWDEKGEPSKVEISKVMVDFSEEDGKRKMVEMNFPPQVISELEDSYLEEIES